ncbi:MAG: hypothetical protein DMG89_09940 [Acidobacteria bacterium]|nr:MAG: hypothetical protein DMG89_09940 [Acidobacteriota bacterium]
MNSIPDREIPAEISSNLRKWNWMARCLRIVQVGLGLVGTASALTVTTFAADIGTLWVKICSFVAALCIGLLAAFDIGGKANATRQACRHLNRAILRYLYLPASSLDNLIDSYSQAQDMVGNVTYRQLQPGQDGRPNQSLEANPAGRRND